MPRDWNAVFGTWAKPASDTEEERCGNAERMVKDATRAWPALRARSIRVFTHGSYRNNTNVRQESDVDICVCLMDVLFDEYAYAPGLSRMHTGIVASDYSFSAFKQEVGNALTNVFGRNSVNRGRKVWAVRENTYRVSADVAPTFEQRRYYWLRDGAFTYASGTKLLTDDGRAIENWPDQHAANLTAKNERTARQFKKIVRITKRLRDEMDTHGIAGAADVPSCLIEGLLWNAHDDHFVQRTLLESARAVLQEVAVHTSPAATCAHWTEVSGMKPLFGPNQTWSQASAHAFALAAFYWIGQ